MTPEIYLRCMVCPRNRNTSVQVQVKKSAKNEGGAIEAVTLKGINKYVTTFLFFHDIFQL